ncbi:hypothetical protein [Myroides fluvii]|uniref:hypothetical protein n=1 Tax=Myroides fluvii TaxID=2572594 RepID=UPI00131E468A|nr:hypothetical protein [Myroides fluvii]
MKKLHLIYAAFILGSAIFWSGCSKNDNDNPDSDPKQEITMPKEAFQLQIVEAQFSQPLLQEEYDADLGGVPLKLVRAEDNTLVFYVPGTTALGTTTLHIPNLDVNTKFEVKESLLNGSEDVVLKPLFEDLSLIKSAITDEEYSAYLANTLTAFEEYYKSLSNDDKNQMALFYQVNESWFNEILNVNQPQGFTTLGVASTLVKTKKLLASVIIFAGSGYILALPGTGIEKSLVTVAGVTAGVLAWKYATELVNEINIVDRVVNQIQGNQITKTTFETQGISFTHNKAQNVHLYTGNRSVTASDQSNTAEGTGIFFDAYGRLTKATEKINNLIQFVNDHVFFANIRKYPFTKYLILPKYKALL